MIFKKPLLSKNRNAISEFTKEIGVNLWNLELNKAVFLLTSQGSEW